MGELTVKLNRCQLGKMAKALDWVEKRDGKAGFDQSEVRMAFGAMEMFGMRDIGKRYSKSITSQTFAEFIARLKKVSEKVQVPAEEGSTIFYSARLFIAVDDTAIHLAGVEYERPPLMSPYALGVPSHRATSSCFSNGFEIKVRSPLVREDGIDQGCRCP